MKVISFSNSRKSCLNVSEIIYKRLTVWSSIQWIILIKLERDVNRRFSLVTTVYNLLSFCFQSLFGWDVTDPFLMSINCGSIIWREHVSIGSGITFLSFAIFFLYLFMRSFLIIILLFLNGIGFQSIIGATTVCYFLNLWSSVCTILIWDCYIRISLVTLIDRYTTLTRGFNRQLPKTWPLPQRMKSMVGIWKRRQ